MEEANCEIGTKKGKQIHEKRALAVERKTLYS